MVFHTQSRGRCDLKMKTSNLWIGFGLVLLTFGFLSSTIFQGSILVLDVVPYTTYRGYGIYVGTGSDQGLMFVPDLTSATFSTTAGCKAAIDSYLGPPPTTNSAPHAEANGLYTGEPNVNIYFTGEGSYDPDGDTITFLWDFGDGKTGTGMNPLHKYTATGTYTIVLKVTDAKGLTQTDTSKATVSTATTPPPPKNNIIPTANAGGTYGDLVDKSIIFSGAESNDPDGSIKDYLWNFGDGSTAHGAVVSHTYHVNGTYTVELWVTDDDGAVGKTTTTCEVINLPDTKDPNEENPILNRWILTMSGGMFVCVGLFLRFKEGQDV